MEKGAFRESNSGPLAPKARIIPLDQTPALLNHSAPIQLNHKKLLTVLQLLYIKPIRATHTHSTPKNPLFYFPRFQIISRFSSKP